MHALLCVCSTFQKFKETFLLFQRISWSVASYNLEFVRPHDNCLNRDIDDYVRPQSHRNMPYFLGRALCLLMASHYIVVRHVVAHWWASPGPVYVQGQRFLISPKKNLEWYMYMLYWILKPSSDLIGKRHPFYSIQRSRTVYIDGLGAQEAKLDILINTLCTSHLTAANLLRKLTPVQPNRLWNSMAVQLNLARLTFWVKWARVISDIMHVHVDISVQTSYLFRDQ